MPLPHRPRVVVTGAGSGLGRALCRVLDERDARIVLADINEESARATTHLLSKAETFVTACDVSKIDEVMRLADFAFDQLGGVDLLINNAGVAVAGNVGEVAIEDWRWVMGVNLWGVVHGCHAFLPRMKKQGSGHILNVASAAGLLSGPRMGPYNVTKAGVVALSETLRGELRGTGVGVSALCPTFFQTNIAKDARGDQSMRAVTERLLAGGKIQADGVARLAIEGVEKNELYIQPHQDGRAMWRLKRLMPERFYDLLPRLAEFQLKRLLKQVAE